MLDVVRRYVRLVGLAVVGVIVLFILVGVAARMYEVSGLGDWLRKRSDNNNSSTGSSTGGGRPHREGGAKGEEEEVELKPPSSVASTLLAVPPAPLHHHHQRHANSLSRRSTSFDGNAPSSSSSKSRHHLRTATATPTSASSASSSPFHHHHHPFHRSKSDLKLADLRSPSHRIIPSLKSDRGRRSSSSLLHSSAASPTSSVSSFFSSSTVTPLSALVSPPPLKRRHHHHVLKHQHHQGPKSTKEVLADFQRSMRGGNNSRPSTPPMFATAAGLVEYSSEEEDEEEEDTAPTAAPAAADPAPPRLGKRMVFVSLVLMTALIVGGWRVVLTVLHARGRRWTQQLLHSDENNSLPQLVRLALLVVAAALDDDDDDTDDEERQALAWAFVLAALLVIGFVYRVLFRRLVTPPPQVPPLPPPPPPTPRLSSQDTFAHVADRLQRHGLDVMRGDPDGATELPSLRAVHSAIELSAVFCIVVSSDDFARQAVYDELSWAIANKPDSALVVIVASQDTHLPAEFQAVLRSISAHVLFDGDEEDDSAMRFLSSVVARERHGHVWDVYLCHYSAAAAAAVLDAAAPPPLLFHSLAHVAAHTPPHAHASFLQLVSSLDGIITPSQAQAVAALLRQE